ncbi:MAG: tetratricopeptide repeat protein [Bacteroidota bacterium]
MEQVRKAWTLKGMKKWGFLALLISACMTLTYCSREPNQAINMETELYLNLHDSVEYVGMNQCRACHQNIYETFIETGMGRSFDHASKAKSDAVFDKHALVYDEELDFYYKPYWDGDTLVIKEFRLSGTDTVHQREERISYIIGSGQHTNSHLINENGYVYQAPITFYTQDQKWDLAPGFEDGANSRFQRIIATECMTCHNHLPEHVEGSQNKYTEVPRGIECERCHGPGEIHVREKLAGNIVDTSKYVDYTIVNPANLPVELEIDICQRCHLQGTAVLKAGKDFFDFRPGMHLAEVMNVFLPRYTNSHDKFIMASQADRMRLSDCFKLSDMSCTTCHNPHESVKLSSVDKYNNICQSCHDKVDQKPVCTENAKALAAENNNCVNCHMPKRGSIDIPHVRITDHNIAIHVDQEEKSDIAKFIGLECLTDENASPLDMAKGYLALYDKFVPERQMLDSAALFLSLSKANSADKFSATVHLLFNLGDYAGIAAQFQALELKQGLDPWSAYRVGEALNYLGNYPEALQQFEAAVKAEPYNLNFQNKLGVAQLRNNQVANAQKTFEFLIDENPKQPIALSNLGFILLQQGNLQKGEQLIDQAIQLDPDYEQAFLNKASAQLALGDGNAALATLEQFLKTHPDARRVGQAIVQLRGGM